MTRVSMVVFLAFALLGRAARCRGTAGGEEVLPRFSPGNTQHSDRQLYGGVPARLARSRVRRGTEHRHRVPGVERATRESSPSRRPGQSEGRPHRHLDHAGTRGGEEGHEHDPDRRHQWRPGSNWSGCESGTAGRQPHWPCDPHRRARAEESTVAEGRGPGDHPGGRPLESRQSNLDPHAEAARRGGTGAGRKASAARGAKSR
jgi:hypothetical protein